MTQIITLTTDFGLGDNFVGVMKGVILSINPDVRIVDINNNIAPHDIYSAAFNITSSYNYFPKGTIHMVIVDPGVGSDRLPIIVEADGHYFIGPDNGVFTLIYKAGKYLVFSISNEDHFLETVSTSFHGRDIFSPVAAKLSLHGDPCMFGEQINNPKMIEVSVPVETDTGLIGQVVYVDHFGNMITNIENDRAGFSDTVIVDDKYTMKISSSYNEGSQDELIAIHGSFGYVELAENQGNAIKRFKEKPRVEIRKIK